MLDQYTREIKETVLSTLAAVLGGVSPTAVTAVALGLGMVCMGLAWQGIYWLSAIFWALNRVADGLDGTLARVNGRQSDLGGYVDILADYVVYGLLPVALVAADPTAAKWLALALLLVSYYVNTASWMYLAAILEKRQAGAAVRGEKTTITMPPALIGGTETILAYFLFILWPAQLATLFYIMAALVVISIFQRLAWAWGGLGD